MNKLNKTMTELVLCLALQGLRRYSNGITLGEYFKLMEIATGKKYPDIPSK